MMSFKFQVSGFKFKVRRSLAGALCALFIVNCSLFIVNCSSYPVDDDGLLITEREECYVSSFGLSGVDRRTVLVGGSSTIVEEDTEDVEDNGRTRPRIEAEVVFGTDLSNVYPTFNLVTDAILEPRITGLTDFSDYRNNPPKYTVISGNRKVRKTYTIYITEQRPRQ